jgi:hypothetical protein
MKTDVEKPLGVTLAFAIGAVLIFAALLTIYVSGAGGDLTRGVEDWAAVGKFAIGTAVLAGIVVDALRWIGARLWPEGDEFPTRTSPSART